MNVALIAAAPPEQVGRRDVVEGVVTRRRTVARAEPADFAGVRAQKPGETEQERRFPRSNRAQQRDGFANANGEIHVAKGDDRRRAAAGASGESFGESANIERELHAPWITGERGAAGIISPRASSIRRCA